MARNELREWLATASLVLSAAAVGLVAVSRFLDNSPNSSEPAWQEVSTRMNAGPIQRFLLETLDHDTLRIPSGDSRSLVIAYSTTCSFCEASLGSWRRLTEVDCPMAVYFVSPEPLETQRNFWAADTRSEDEGCEKPVIGRLLDPAGFARTYKLIGTPAHYILHDGQLRRQWNGAVMVESYAKFRRGLAGGGS